MMLSSFLTDYRSVKRRISVRLSGINLRQSARKKDVLITAEHQPSVVQLSKSFPHRVNPSRIIGQDLIGSNF